MNEHNLMGGKEQFHSFAEIKILVSWGIWKTYVQSIFKVAESTLCLGSHLLQVVKPEANPVFCERVFIKQDGDAVC